VNSPVLKERLPDGTGYRLPVGNGYRLVPVTGWYRLGPVTGGTVTDWYRWPVTNRHRCIPNPDTCEIQVVELMDILETIKNELETLNLKNNELIKQPPIDSSYRFTNNEYHTLTGLYREEFDELCSIIPTSAIYNTDLRSSRQAIGCLLAKLRLGLSHEILATLFGLPDRKSFTRVLESSRLPTKKSLQKTAIKRG
jgi:hypothetical protein